MIDGLGGATDPGVDISVGLDRLARGEFVAAHGFQGRLARQVAGDLDPFAQGPLVLFRRQVVGVNRRIVERVGRLQPHPAATFRTQLADMDRKTILGDGDLAMVLHDGHDAVQLQIRPVQVGPRLQESPGLEEVLPARPLSPQHVVQTRDQPVQALVIGVGGRRAGGLPGQHHVQVVLEILADPLELVGHGDTVRRQVFGVADAGQLQHLGRLRGAAAQQHLGVGIGDLVFLGLALHIFDPDRAALFDDDAGRTGLDGRGQVRALAQDRAQIAGRGAPALAIADGQLVRAETLLLETVEVLGELVTRLGPGADEAGKDRAGRRGLGDIERPLAAMIGVGPALEGLGAFEIGQHLGIGPAPQPHLAPLVIVAGMAADIDHAIDRGRAAPALAARPPQLAVFQIGFRLGPEAPVIGPLIGQQRAHARGHLDQDRVVLAAGFQQQHLDLGIGGQPVGQHAAGRAGADDDIVVTVQRALACAQLLFVAAMLARRMQKRKRDDGGVNFDVAELSASAEPASPPRLGAFYPGS